MPDPLPRLTFAEMLEKLWRERYTGPLIVQFGQGVAHEAHIPAQPTRFVLDNAPVPRA